MTVPSKAVRTPTKADCNRLCGGDPAAGDILHDLCYWWIKCRQRQVYKTHADLASRLGLNERLVKRKVAQLIAAGIVVAERKCVSGRLGPRNHYAPGPAFYARFGQGFRTVIEGTRAEVSDAIRPVLRTSPARTDHTAESTPHSDPHVRLSDSAFGLELLRLVGADTTLWEMGQRGFQPISQLRGDGYPDALIRRIAVSEAPKLLRATHALAYLRARVVAIAEAERPEWAALLADFVKGDLIPDDWDETTLGPRPGHPDCLIPAGTPHLTEATALFCAPFNAATPANGVSSTFGEG